MSEFMLLQGQKNKRKRDFFLLWIGINVGGWGLLMAVIPNTGVFGGSDTLVYISFLVIGSAMGIFQWLLLRERFAMAWYEWIIASTTGFCLGTIASLWALLLDLYIVKTPPSSPILHWDPLIGGALFGLALGVCQGFVWRQRFIQFFAWVVVNVLGWSLGRFLPQLMIFLLRDVVTFSSTSILYLILPVAFAAVATGVVLVWFLENQHELAKQA